MHWQASEERSWKIGLQCESNRNQRNLKQCDATDWMGNMRRKLLDLFFFHGKHFAMHETLSLFSLCRRSLSHCNELSFSKLKWLMQSSCHPCAVAFVSAKCLCGWRAKAWITSQFFSSVELEWPREWFLLHCETCHCFSVQWSFCHAGLDHVVDMGIWVLHFVNFCHCCSNFSSFVSTTLSRG